eukprot:scaffold54825_cov34-Tisochrysis_lutea.AAC.3
MPKGRAWVGLTDSRQAPGWELEPKMGGARQTPHAHAELSIHLVVALARESPCTGAATASRSQSFDS